jgi:phage virion morphogenesis protein
MFKLNVKDADLKSLLKRLGGKMDDMTPFMRDAAGIMHDAVEENFAQGGRPKWRPSKRVALHGGQTLQKSGQLASSISKRWERRSAVVGTNKVYGPIQQLGGKAGRGKKVTIPKRPYLKLTPEDIVKLINKCKQYLVGR